MVILRKVHSIIVKICVCKPYLFFSDELSQIQVLKEHLITTNYDRATHPYYGGAIRVPCHSPVHGDVQRK